VEKKTKDKHGISGQLEKIRSETKQYEQLKNRCNQLESEVAQNYRNLQKITEGIVNIVSKVIETRDPYSEGHHGRVAKLAIAIAAEMKLSEKRIDGIKFSSMIHDLGKVSLPTDIVSRPGKLFEVEFNLIKNHPNVGYEILKKIEFPWPVAEIVLQHHEKIDGSGYPQGLKGNQILLEAKIICIADVIESMSSSRSYRPAVSIDICLKEIIENKNKLFDSKAVDACVKLFKEKNFRF